MEWVLEYVDKVSRRRYVVRQAANRSCMSSHINFLPLSKEIDEEVSLKLFVKDLREEVEVGDQRSLQDDGDVGRVEQLDGVRLLVALHLPRRHCDLNTEAL